MTQGDAHEATDACSAKGTSSPATKTDAEAGLRRSGRARKAPVQFYSTSPPPGSTSASARGTGSAATRSKRGSGAADESLAGLDDDGEALKLLRDSLSPWKEGEQAQWPSWIEVESDPELFNAILKKLGVNGAKIEEVFCLDDESLALLPAPVYGLIFLYQYNGDETQETQEAPKELWFANQTTSNACATIAMLNILMNANDEVLGEKLAELKKASMDLTPAVRGNLISHSDWIRTAHNSFARRLDLLDAALYLENEYDKSKKKRGKARVPRAGKKKKPSDVAYHFIAFVPVGNTVWQLDGMEAGPVAIGEFAPGEPWTSVAGPVISARMMQYETEQISFNLLAMCGDQFGLLRRELAVNIRCLQQLDTKRSDSPGWSDFEDDERVELLDGRDANLLANYGLDKEDIEILSRGSTLLAELQSRGFRAGAGPDECKMLRGQLYSDQQHILSRWVAESGSSGVIAGGALGRTQDYTPAIHAWLSKLAEHGRGCSRSLHQAASATPWAEAFHASRCASQSRSTTFLEQGKRKKEKEKMSKRTSGAVASAAAANGASSSKELTDEPSYDKQKDLLSSETGHFSLIRAMHLADLITELNGACGILSIFSSLRYCLGDPAQRSNIYLALAFLPLGLFFDFFDGKVARWRKKSSMMGQELDSLADLISFGVAPAVVAFSIGIRTPLDHLCLAFFVLCGLTRLARFNVTAGSIPKDATGKASYFEGTPIPTSLGLDAMMAWWVSQGWILDAIPGGVWFAGTPLEFHPVVLVFMIHGCLMTSKTIHVPKP
ncbi:hypothetical protein QBC47DRAFT_303367 [Echria macrotheca]|uniref:Ubiquitin carboxyl-terminal hydrolase n=1 Tax=Echria macrotheca TaxID=438768 RepID=A0AAJ0F3I3_9PEZI|nr:hypothetical protein QBC47DRAFT_303367 [Echria macrotheca]